MGIPGRRCSFMKMTDHLEAMIAAGRYRPGDKLPVLRDLAAEFALNLDTARRGIWYLRDKGLLECHKRSGIFVKAEKESRKKELLRLEVFLETEHPDMTYCAHVLHGVREEAELCNVQLRRKCGVVSTMFSDERLREEANQNDAVLLLGNFDLAKTDFSWLKCPGVGVEMHCMFGGHFSVISMDPVNSAELAAEYFRKRRIRHVRIFGHDSVLHHFRAQVFQQYFISCGGTADYRIWNNTACPEMSLNDGAGYLFTGGEAFQQWSKIAGAAWKNDHVVLSLDGKSLLLPGYLPVDTVTPDWPQLGRLALREAVHRALTAGASARRIYSDVQLFEADGG